MKRTLFMLALAAAVFALPASAQFRYGFQGGCALEERAADYAHEYSTLAISGMLFGLHGEYRYRGVDLYASPNFIVHSSVDRLELPVGAKFLFTESGIAPYVSGGLSAVYYFPITVSYATWLDAGYDMQNGRYTYRPLNMRASAAFGVQFGSRDAAAFALELRYHRRIGTLAGVTPPSTPLDDFSVVTVFLF